VSAYEEIAKIIRVMDQGNDPEYSKHVGAMKKMALDSNAAAIDVGLDTLNIYIPLADQALRYRASWLHFIERDRIFAMGDS